MKKSTKKPIRPPQKQVRPGKEQQLLPGAASFPKPHTEGKLAGKVALITGGDSGIGRAVALLFAKEGADIAISYLSETKDANDTVFHVKGYERNCIALKGDIGNEAHCRSIVNKVIKHFGRLDIVVNNAAMHWESDSLENISTRQLLKTFNSNFFSCFWISKYALPHLKEGACIINTSSVTAYRGSPKLIDYSASKGAIISFTRSLSTALLERKIRVNAVAPGPVWTPLIASSFDKKKVAAFGSDAPMERAGEPNEIAPAFLFLASNDASYITGQVIHPNGGEIING